MNRISITIRMLAPIFAIAIVLVLATTADACPTCKDGIAESDPATRSMAAGYFYSILFMMSMPFILLGTLGSFAYLSVRKAKRESP